MKYRNIMGVIIYAVMRGLAWIVAHLAGYYRVSGQENVPATGPLLIVANHLSWFDPFLLAIVVQRRVWFFTKEEIFRWPVIGQLARATGQIPVLRGESDRAALEKALSYLRQGKALVIFPEGTVERQERMIAAHTGVAMLAVRSGTTVLPIAHSGTRRILRPRRGWFPCVIVRIGCPYRPELPQDTTRKAGLQHITNEIMQHIAQMLPPEQRGAYCSALDDKS
jgi:1-acyl-sn-glycerol-3-phosphate acyltransferase